MIRTTVTAAAVLFAPPVLSARNSASADDCCRLDSEIICEDALCPAGCDADCKNCMGPGSCFLTTHFSCLRTDCLVDCDLLDLGGPIPECECSKPGQKLPSLANGGLIALGTMLALIGMGVILRRPWRTSC